MISRVEYLYPNPSGDEISSEYIIKTLNEIEPNAENIKTIGFLHVLGNAAAQQSGLLEASIHDWRRSHSNERNWRIIGFSQQKEFIGNKDDLALKF